MSENQMTGSVGTKRIGTIKPPVETCKPPNKAPVSLTHILVVLDASDHANRALAETVRLANSANGELTGIHVFAARPHDRRFKMMEGGLPERCHNEEEMGYQREVHDDLITRECFKQRRDSMSYHEFANTSEGKGNFP